MAARPDCLAAWADRKFLEAYPSFGEKVEEIRGQALRTGQNQQCWGRSASFSDH